MAAVAASGSGTRGLAAWPIEAVSVLYLLAYLPYMVITRALATTPDHALGRPLTGLETLPAVMIMGGAMVALFIWLSGWWRAAHRTRAGLPKPTRWTFLAGIGTAFLLFTVPLSLTFPGVSIPFMQLLMRGDVLLVAPLVDLIAGRKVRWYSWTALGLVAVGLGITLKARGGLHLPPLAIATVIAYTLGYFVRLAAMTKVAKDGSEQSLKGYFVEEKLVALPLSVLALALIGISPLAAQGQQLAWGFLKVWTSDAMPLLIALSVAYFAVTVFSALILLNPRENTFCVPFERAASIIAGLLAAYLLSAAAGQPAPTGPELIGALLLIGAIALLALAPRLGRRAKDA